MEDYPVEGIEAAKTRLRRPARLLHDLNHHILVRPIAAQPTPGRRCSSRAGWITFDPTNRSVGGRNLIPVAVARDISQCTPVSGNFFGPNDSFVSMDVTVSVTS
jgi:hypothetical protein